MHQPGFAGAKGRRTIASTTRVESGPVGQSHVPDESIWDRPGHFGFALQWNVTPLRRAAHAWCLLSPDDSPLLVEQINTQSPFTLRATQPALQPVVRLWLQNHDVAFHYDIVLRGTPAQIA